MEIGERIGDYEILGILGAGGMGQVYKVRNVISDRVEAMKVLLPNLEADPELGDRFLREIKVQASLEHPNIAALRTAQRVGNSILMVMEFVEGKTIEAMMRDHPLPVEKAIDYATQVLAALDYAHQRGVIHRDIKPANMMVTPAGVVKLMDFGIARLVQDERLTQTGRTVGSLYYMSPEQIRGESTLDGRADIYSLGVALYEMATGKRPFEGDSAYSVMAAHLQQMPAPPIQVDPKLPAALNEIILMAIAKDPAQRFQTAAAMRAALLRLTPGAQAAPAPPKVATPPATPVAPAAAQSAIAPAHAAPARTSRRWLYMTVGSLATIAVLIVAAVQVPKWRGARAVSPSVPVTGTAAEAQAPQPQPAGALPAAVPAPAPEALPPLGGSQRRADALRQAEAARRTASPAAPGMAPVAQPPSTAQPAAQSQVVTQSNDSPTQPAKAPARTQAAPEAASAADPAREKALADQRQRLMLMAARVNAVKMSMSNLQRQQAAAGMGMRGDMVAAHQRMEFHLDEGERALKGGDAAAAKRSFDAAERELERLEGWLGR
jgi:serine/threonine-protein kinase